MPRCIKFSMAFMRISKTVLSKKSTQDGIRQSVELNYFINCFPTYHHHQRERNASNISAVPDLILTNFKGRFLGSTTTTWTTTTITTTTVTTKAAFHKILNQFLGENNNKNNIIINSNNNNNFLVGKGMIKSFVSVLGVKFNPDIRIDISISINIKVLV